MRSIEHGFRSVLLVALATGSVACGEDDGAPYVQGQADIIEAQREAREISSGPPTSSGTTTGADPVPPPVSPLGPEANSSDESSADVEPPRMQLSERP
jgi:hypothetical protein